MRSQSPSLTLFGSNSNSHSPVLLWVKKQKFYYWHCKNIHFVANGSQLSFIKGSFEKSININHHYGNVEAAWCQHLTEISIKLKCSSGLTDCPPSRFFFLSLVYCWPLLTNTLIWVCTWAGMPFRDGVGPSKSRWMSGMVGCTGQLLCSQEQPSTLPWYSRHYHFFSGGHCLAYVAAPAASVACPSDTVVKPSRRT